MKKITYITLIGLMISNLVGYFLLYSEFQDEISFVLREFIFCSLAGIITAILSWKSSDFLNKVFPYKSRTGIRITIGYVFHFGLSIGMVILTMYIYHYFYSAAGEFKILGNVYLLKWVIILSILSLFFEVIYFALYSYYSFSKFQIDKLKIERKQNELQLRALKSQLSPHFLFNCLNTISSLIFKNDHQAEQFIRRLANLYDFTLTSYDSKLITLKEELEFVRSYFFLMETRFALKFNYQIDISNDLMEKKLPPLALQMLVENAFKHNQFSDNHPLQISIKADAKALLIQNNITKPNPHTDSFGVGLTNIKSRYLLLANKEISVVKTSDFTVKIPLLS